TAQHQVITQRQFARYRSQRLSLYQRGAHARQLAFTGLGKISKQPVGNDLAELGITKKLEPLVVQLAVGTAVGECLLKQARIGKGITEGASQPGRIRTHWRTLFLNSSLKVMAKSM